MSPFASHGVPNVLCYISPTAVDSPGDFLALEPAIAPLARVLHSLGGAVGRRIFVRPLARRHVRLVLRQKGGPVVRDEQDSVKNVVYLS